MCVVTVVELMVVGAGQGDGDGERERERERASERAATGEGFVYFCCVILRLLSAQWERKDGARERR